MFFFIPTEMKAPVESHAVPDNSLHWCRLLSGAACDCGLMVLDAYVAAVMMSAFHMWF